MVLILLFIQVWQQKANRCLCVAVQYGTIRAWDKTTGRNECITHPKLLAKRRVDGQDLFSPKTPKEFFSLVFPQGSGLIWTLSKARTDDGRQEGLQHPNIPVGEPKTQRQLNIQLLICKSMKNKISQLLVMAQLQIFTQAIC